MIMRAAPRHLLQMEAMGEASKAVKKVRAVDTPCCLRSMVDRLSPRRNARLC